MAISKDKKKEVIKQIGDAVDQSQSVVFVNFHGLGVGDATAMRDVLREKGVGYYVARKTLIKLALSDKTVEGDQPLLEGEIALAYSDDPVAAAREIYTFGKQFEGALSIVGGIFEGEYRDQAAMTEIAQIPSKETLYAQFLNIINSPIQQFAIAIDQIAESKS